MFVFKAAVVGAGTMGGQIAQTIAAAGIPVLLKDISQELVDHGLEEARTVTSGTVAKLVKKGKLTEDQGAAQVEEVMGRITGTLDYAGFGDVDFVIEAVPERMEIKSAVFAELDAVTPGHAILASNTSSLSISEIAYATFRPDKVVGFHYFYPASVMPLIEIVEGDETSSETTQAALNFAQAIKKNPIVCQEVPGFVVNRILNSGIAEIWREQEAKGLSIQKIDEGVGAANVVPMGPYFLVGLLGLDTVLHVAEHLHAAYDMEGEEPRFYVPDGMSRLVSEGKLGAKSGGDGFYDTAGNPNLAGDAEPDIAELVELLVLKTFVEAALVLEEGVATHRDIDVGMMAGAGLDPRRGLFPPFMKADMEGLDTLLERLEQATERHGERFTPPRILIRMVAQGRLGQKSGQGFYAWPQFDADPVGESVKLETREDGVAIAWLANGQMNSIAPTVIDDLAKVHAAATEAGIRALVIASSNPLLFSAGADIKAFTQMDEAGGKELLDRAHGTLRAMEQSPMVTVCAVNGLAFGGGCELAMACDVRIAAQSAIFGQPEIKLGIIPGFGGTQRLPRLVGTNKALEMNLTGDAIGAREAFEFGLVNRVVVDHELLDTALAWARKLAGQAPLAVEQIKRVSGKSDLDEGIAAEKAGFAVAFGSEDGKEGIAAFLGEAHAAVAGEVSGTLELARRIAGARSVVALTGAGISVPSGIPDFRTPGTGLWENVNPMEVAHIDAWRADPERFWHFYGDRFTTLREKAPNGAHAVLVELERRGQLDAVITQNIDTLHHEAGSQDVVQMHGTILRSLCLVDGAEHELDDVLERIHEAEDGVPRCDDGHPLKPAVTLFGELLDETAMERAIALCRGADVLLCVGSSLEVHPVAALPGIVHAQGGTVALITAGPTPWDDRAAVKLAGDVVEELEALLDALDGLAAAD